MVKHALIIFYKAFYFFFKINIEQKIYVKLKENLKPKNKYLSLFKYPK